MNTCAPEGISMTLKNAPVVKYSFNMETKTLNLNLLQFRLFIYNDKITSFWYIWERENTIGVLQQTRLHLLCKILLCLLSFSFICLSGTSSNDIDHTAPLVYLNLNKFYRCVKKCNLKVSISLFVWNWKNNSRLTRCNYLDLLPYRWGQT